MSFAAVLTLGHPDTRTHEAAAAAVLRVLEANDVEAETLAAPLPDLFEHLAAGRIDLLSTAWLPELDAARPGPARLDLLAGSLYRPFPVCAVPAGAFPGAGTLSDLAGFATGTGNGVEEVLVAAELEPFAAPALERCGLAGAAPTVLPADALFERADAAVAAGRPVLLLLCQPHPLLRGDALRILRDPDGVLPGVQEARIALRPGLRDRLDPDLVDELEALTLGNPVVSAMEQAMRRDGLSAADAAEAWQRGKLTPRG